MKTNSKKKKKTYTTKIRVVWNDDAIRGLMGGVSIKRKGLDEAKKGLK